MKVRCSSCQTWLPKNEALSYGLGHVCNATCRARAVSSRSKRINKNNQGALRRGFFYPDQQRKKANRNVASPEKRRYIQERDGKRCRFCQAATGLHVHHIRYRSEGGDHDERNLITLCLRCHDVVHSSKKHWQPVLKELIRQHYDEEEFMFVPQVELLLYGIPPVVLYG